MELKLERPLLFFDIESTGLDLRNITRKCTRVKNRRMPNGTYGGVRGR